MKAWSDRSILKSLPNPETRGYEVKIKNPEVTFLGVRGQPDFAIFYITFYPRDTVIELKSLKVYFYQFRMEVLSYERLINVVYEDLIAVYNPVRLRIVAIFSVRGGMDAKVTIDSYWSIRGGEENFKDWIVQQEEW